MSPLTVAKGESAWVQLRLGEGGGGSQRRSVMLGCTMGGPGSRVGVLRLHQNHVTVDFRNKNNERREEARSAWIPLQVIFFVLTSSLLSCAYVRGKQCSLLFSLPLSGAHITVQSCGGGPYAP